MEMGIRLSISLFVTLWYIWVNRKAAGNLSIERMNPIHFMFFLSTMYFFIGSNLMFVGFRNSYVLAHLDESIVDKAYIFLMYSMLAFPLVIYVCNRIVGIHNYQAFYVSYIRRPAQLQDEKRIFSLACIAALLCFLSACYTFYYIGYVPQLKLLTGGFSTSMDIAVARIDVSRHFQGNQYIRNLFFLGLSTWLSYLAYIYYKITNSYRWRRLFFSLLLLAILGKTYNFEKAPVLIYFIHFFLIDILLGKVKNVKKILKYTFLIIMAIVFMYSVMGYKGDFLTLNSGPVSRVLFGQLKGYFYHIQIFPSVHDYLYGSGVSRVLNVLFGLEGTAERSARIVMEIYNPAGVKSGTAGVINSYFTAEAYANFGIPALLVAPLIVGSFYSVVSIFILSQKKDPIYMVLFIEFVTGYAHGIGGGFFNFFYNPGLWFLAVVLVSIKALANRGKIPLSFKIHRIILLKNG